MHRQKADEAYEIGARGQFTPVGAYLAGDEIIKIALQHDVNMIHPGYGFLSENSEFARKVEEAGLIVSYPLFAVLIFLFFPYDECGDEPNFLFVESISPTPRQGQCLHLRGAVQGLLYDVMRGSACRPISLRHACMLVSPAHSLCRQCPDYFGEPSTTHRAKR